MNFILADNQELTAFAIQSLLKQDEKNKLYRAVDKAGLIQLLKEHEDSVVILDFTMFDFADGDSLVIVGERFAMTSWVLVSDELTKDFLRKVIYASHAFSVVFKDEPMKTIRDAIQAAAAGKRYISQRTTETLLMQTQEEEEPAVLTATEIEIVKAIAQGKTTKEIASERFSSVHTITTHRKNIFRKLGINTAHEAVKYALRAGWVDPSEFYI
ncbi:MAG: response regulator transcription factor [Prevotella sp.]|nr:response regulator transcription factor [Prevotella sp.]